MRIFDLARKDLVQIIRDWKSALFLVVMPVLFTFFFGFIFAPGDADADSRLPVGLADMDPSGVLGAHLHDLLAGSDVVRPVALDDTEEAAIDEQVRGGDLAAAVVVPAGLSAQALAGESPQLTVIADQATTAGQTAHSGIDTAVSRLMGAVSTARISAEQYAGARGFAGEAAREAYLQEAVALAIDEWQQPPLRVATEQATGAAGAGEDTPGGFAQSSPGMMVQFAIFGLITSAMVLVLERKTGALKRLLTTPTHRAAVIGGHVLAMFLVVFFQQVLLVAVGQLLFGVDYLQAPLATLAMMVSLSLWAASLGLLIGALATKEEQVITWSLIAMFVFAALGGAWFPLEFAGEAFSTVGHVMPTAWAMDGLQNIVVRGQGLPSVLLPTGILLAYTAAFFGLAVWQFRFE
ncbi:MAG: ABC transporter permease [Anaerolineae bacterium]|jgi:ABC-2 type transport system permease protein